MNKFRFVMQVILTTLTTYIMAQFFPWWTMALCATCIAFLLQTHKFLSFLAGFIGTGFLWMIAAAIIDVQTNSILSKKIAPIFHLPSPMFLILLTGFIGGVVGGISAWTGTHLRNLWWSKSQRYY